MTPTASNVVVGVFNSPEKARDTLAELKKFGFGTDAVSVVARADDGVGTAGSSLATDAGIGAALGGIGGLLLSFAALAVPGVGPIIAAGPILTALGGAGVGAVAGGLIGALTEAGVPEADANYYAEGVRRGGVVVTVHATGPQAERARDIMNSHGALDIERRVSGWRERGWAGHNPGAEPISADEIRREHDYYAAAENQAYEWEHMTDKERKHSSTGDAAGTDWPHRDAHDIGESLAAAEAGNASDDSERTANAAEQTLGTDRQDLQAQTGTRARIYDRNKK